MRKAKSKKQREVIAATNRDVAVFKPDETTGGEIVDTDAIVIGELYERSNSSLAEAVVARLECGRRLAEKKDSMQHGVWLPWLQENAGVLGFDSRLTASRLIKAAKANPTSTSDWLLPVVRRSLRPHDFAKLRLKARLVFIHA